MLKNILVATDFSAASRAALRAALRLCKSRLATLHVVYVLPVMEGRIHKVMSKLAEKDIQAFLPSRLYAKNRKKILFCNSIPEAILDYAQKQKCDLIVLGWKNRSGIGDFLTGSIMRELLQSSSIPLMLACESRTRKPRSYKFKRILVPFDFSALSKRTLSFAVKAAKLFDADLHVIYVLDSVEQASWIQKADAKLKALLAKQIQTARIPARRVTRLALTGTPTGAIRKYTYDNHIDLIVMGAQPRRGIAAVLLKSTASRILSRTNTPEIVIP